MSPSRFAFVLLLKVSAVSDLAAASLGSAQTQFTGEPLSGARGLARADGYV
jgi:hypothetical protein